MEPSSLDHDEEAAHMRPFVLNTQIATNIAKCSLGIPAEQFCEINPP